MNSDQAEQNDIDRANMQVTIGIYNFFQHDFRIVWTFDADDCHSFDIMLVTDDQEDRMVGSVMVMPSGLTPVTFEEEGAVEAGRLCGPLLLPITVQACRELSQALRDQKPLQTDYLFTPAATCPASLVPPVPPR